MRFAIALCLCLGLVQPAFGQHEHHEGLAPKDIGTVEFTTSCNPATKTQFNEAVALLHSFWFAESRALFEGVLKTDSNCAMAYWGIALTHWGNPFGGLRQPQVIANGKAAIDKAQATGSPTPREKGYITAVAGLFSSADPATQRERVLEYERAMGRVSVASKDDVEARIFWALAVAQAASPTDKTYARQLQAAEMLEPMWAKMPKHPGLAHYIIHANDSPRLAHLGLDAARRYAGIAPAAPHAQHMPSHIFIRLGLWNETVESNRHSYEAGVQYARAQGLQGVDYHEFHAQDYMVYGFLQQGRDSAARATVDEAMAVTVVRSPSPLVGSYNRVAMEARLYLERSDWRGAAALPVRYEQPATSEMLSRFTRGIGAARSGNAAQARDELAALARIEQGLTAANDSYWSRVAGIKRQALNAWVLLAAGDTTGALREAKEAADKEDVTAKHPITPGELLPARELEGDLHLQLGHYAAARSAYQATLRNEPGRARAMFGQARAAQLAGDRTAASQGYREFIQLQQPGDGRREELATARAGASR
jgi:hypothetical protein